MAKFKNLSFGQASNSFMDIFNRFVIYLHSVEGIQTKL